MMTLVVSGGQLGENLFEKLLGDGVDIGGGFVEDQQLGASQGGAHERDQLLLAQADAVAAAGYFRIQTFREAREQAGRLDFSRMAASCSVEQLA